LISAQPPFGSGVPCAPCVDRLGSLLVAVTLFLAGPSPAEADETYSEPFHTAIAELPGATEVRTGYSRTLFRHWVDADGDGCDARKEPAAISASGSR
jgi:hypothetical protein